MSRNAVLVLLAIGLLGGWWHLRTPSVPQALDARGLPLGCSSSPARPGPEPMQVDLPGGQAPFLLDQVRVTPRAGFAIEATVLGSERYHSDRGAAIAPLDLALGWGPMADPAVYGALGIRQSGRWYTYRWGPEGPPIPVGEIVRHSSNMHMVPASPAVAAQLMDVEVGQRVRLRGWLVDAETPEGYRWHTSLSRTDSGDGACEIVYVCDVAVLP